MKKKINLVDLALLQLAVVIYSVNTVVGKYVGISLKENGVFDIQTLGLMFIEVAILGVYAIFWQQMIKKFELSIAYANKALTLLWSLLWSTFLFHEAVTIKKILGVLLVIAGTIILNGTGKTKEQEEELK